MKRKISFIFIDSAHGESTSPMPNSCCAVSTRTIDLVVAARLDEHLGDRLLHLVERRLQHLLGIDARRIDVRVVDAHQRVVEDAQRRQIIRALVFLLRRAQRLACADVDAAVRPDAANGDAQGQRQRDEDEDRFEVAAHEGLGAGCLLEEVHRHNYTLT